MCRIVKIVMVTVLTLEIAVLSLQLYKDYLLFFGNPTNDTPILCLRSDALRAIVQSAYEDSIYCPELCYLH